MVVLEIPACISTYIIPCTTKFQYMCNGTVSAKTGRRRINSTIWTKQQRPGHGEERVTKIITFCRINSVLQGAQSRYLIPCPDYLYRRLQPQAQHLFCFSVLSHTLRTPLPSTKAIKRMFLLKVRLFTSITLFQWSTLNSENAPLHFVSLRSTG